MDYDEIPNNLALNEYDLQEENGILWPMQEYHMATYSFWPSLDIKKNIDLKVFQRHVTNFKLECANNPTKSMQELVD